MALNVNNTMDTQGKNYTPPLTPASNNFFGRFVRVLDRSYLEKSDLKAGAGPGMLNGLGEAVVTFACLFATCVATLAVGISSLAWTPPLITLGCGLAATALIHAKLKL